MWWKKLGLRLVDGTGAGLEKGKSGEVEGNWVENTGNKTSWKWDLRFEFANDLRISISEGAQAVLDQYHFFDLVLTWIDVLEAVGPIESNELTSAKVAKMDNDKINSVMQGPITKEMFEEDPFYYKLVLDKWSKINSPLTI